MQHQITSQQIYLDHAATTPLSETAGAAMEACLYEPYGNPSSMHQVGRQAYDALYESRRTLAEALSVDPQEIILTGSGTESDNLALLGLARRHREHGNHVIISAIEHKAVLAAAEQLEREGFSVTRLPVDASGMVSVVDLKTALQPETILVSIMYANNEIGTVEPIGDVVQVCKEFRQNSQYPLVHTDACQAVGMLQCVPHMLGVDAMTINSSKIYGPKGVGLLYLRRGVSIQPLIVGGDQEHGIRAGTENIALIAGFATALTEAVAHTHTHGVVMKKLQSYFIQELLATVPGIAFNGHSTDRLPNNVHVTIPDIEGESLVLMLSEAGICCATGSACSSRDLEPSHVLHAIGQSDDVIHGSLRFTFGRTTTKEALSHTARVLGEVVKQLRTITACTTEVYKQQKARI